VKRIQTPDLAVDERGFEIVDSGHTDRPFYGPFVGRPYFAIEEGLNKMMASRDERAARQGRIEHGSATIIP
jgi:hypothetical protein